MRTTDPHAPDTQVDSLLRRIAAAPDVEDVHVRLVDGAIIDDKYRIDGVLGQGGMGIVYRATDVRLQRTVAIKLPALSTRELERLRREARTLARLVHPNVVAVLDAGLVGGATYLAMEHVDGGSARSWLAASPRRWSSIVALFLDAGRGLAAAHAAGIAHGDFKLDNVLVGSDGRARVSDFGLAADIVTSSDPSESIGGTPAYLAPERLHGRPADAAADQFAFCVSLWEAVYGEHPYLPERRGAQMGGEPRPPASPERAPSWLRRVLERGMHRESDRRYPDMEALLHALQRRGRMRRVVAVPLGACALVAAIAFAQPDARPPCEDLTARLQTTWNDVRRDELRAAAGDEARAADYVARLESRVDAFADEWREVASIGCAPGPRACLDRSLVELAAVLDLADTPSEALLRAEQLPTPRSCLQSASAPVDAQPERARGLRADLARISARIAAFDVTVEDAQLDRIVDRARELGDDALVAEALLQRSLHHTQVGRRELASEDMSAAYFAATRADQDRLAVTIAAHLPKALLEIGRLDDAWWWAEHARALARRRPDDVDGSFQIHIALSELAVALGDVDTAESALETASADAARTPDRPLRHAKVLDCLANVAHLRGHYDDAVDLYERALQEHAKALGEEHYQVGELIGVLGWALDSAGRPAEARAAFERSIAVLESAVGSESALLVAPTTGLALLDAREGEPARALARLDALRERGIPERGPWEFSVRVDELSGDALAGLRRPHDSLAAYERALATRERVMGPDHPDLVQSINNVALELIEVGDPDRARQAFDRAIELSARHGDRDLAVAALLRFNLGFLLLDLQENEDALRLFEEARALQERVLPPDHLDYGWTFLGIGQAQVVLGRKEAAVEPLEAAWALWQPGTVNPRDRGLVAFALARALEGTDDERALELAREAQQLRPDDPAIAGFIASR